MELVKIWKYASCFVVRVDDLRLFDCAGIQVCWLAARSRARAQPPAIATSLARTPSFFLPVLIDPRRRACSRTR